MTTMIAQCQAERIVQLERERDVAALEAYNDLPHVEARILAMVSGE